MTDLICVPAERTSAKDVFDSTPIDTNRGHVELPEGFKMRDDGLYLESKDGDELIAGRFWILSRSRDFANENHGIEIEFDDDDDVRHHISIPRADLMGRAPKVIERLISDGLHVGHDCGPLLAQALFESKITRTSRRAERIGWQANHVYVLPHVSFGCGSEQVKLEEALTRDSGFAWRGSLDAWKRTASMARGNSLMLFAGSVAFAGPLLDIVSSDSMLFHLRGPSSIGKTTAARFAASVWGLPTLAGGFMSTWRSTTNALELLSASRRDTCLVLDEVQMANPKDVAAAAYMIASGSGKQRMNRDLSKAKQPKWRTSVLSTGELSLASYLHTAGARSTGGQSVRFIDIPADAKQGLGLFQTLHSAPAASDLARLIASNLEQNFGHAGPEFVERVLAYPDRCKARIEQIMASFESKNCPSDADGQVRRVCGQFGLVAAAGDLAAQFQVAPWTQDEATAAAQFCFASWLAERGHSGSHEIAQAISHVRSEILRNEATGIGSWVDDLHRQPTFGYRRLSPNDLSGFYIHLWKMEDLLRGFDKKSVLEALKQGGSLKTDRDRLTKQARDPRDPSQKRNVRFYCLSLDFIEADAGADASKDPTLHAAT